MAWKKLTEEEINEDEYESEFWKPETGDTIQGIVKKVKEGQYDKLFLVIEEENGDIWVTTQCKSLHNQIKKLGIEKDDLVHITYNGRADDEYGSHQYVLQKWEED